MCPCDDLLYEGTVPSKHKHADNKGCRISVDASDIRTMLGHPVLGAACAVRVGRRHEITRNAAGDQQTKSQEPRSWSYAYCPFPESKLARGENAELRERRPVWVPVNHSSLPVPESLAPGVKNEGPQGQGQGAEGRAAPSEYGLSAAGLGATSSWPPVAHQSPRALAASFTTFPLPDPAALEGISIGVNTCRQTLRTPPTRSKRSNQPLMRVFGLDGVLAARLAESIALDPDLSTMDGERMRAWSTSAHVKRLSFSKEFSGSS